MTPWTVARQAPLTMGFSRQEYWTQLPFPPPGDLPHPGVKPMSLLSSAWAGVFFTTSATWEAADFPESSSFFCFKCVTRTHELHHSSLHFFTCYKCSELVWTSCLCLVLWVSSAVLPFHMSHPVALKTFCSPSGQDKAESEGEAVSDEELG